MLKAAVGVSLVILNCLHCIDKIWSITITSPMVQVHVAAQRGLHVTLYKRPRVAYKGCRGLAVVGVNLVIPNCLHCIDKILSITITSPMVQVHVAAQGGLHVTL